MKYSLSYIYLYISELNIDILRRAEGQGHTCDVLGSGWDLLGFTARIYNL